MTITVDAEGFVHGFEVGKRSYRELQHPALSYSLAKAVLACPEDAWRITQKREEIEREETGAMSAGTVLDSLLTGPDYEDVSGHVGCSEYTYKSGKNKGEIARTEWHDWNGLRIVACEEFSTMSAQLAKKEGEAAGLTVVKLADFNADRRRARELLIRFELADFDIAKYMGQVGLYWTETARNGRKIQCRGRLDFLSHDWTSIVDLKRVEDLSQLSLERAVDRYRWAMQAAAYSSAVGHLKEGLVPTWAWLFARTSPVVACTLRTPEAALLEAGRASWLRAVNEWAEGLATGIWRGHEADHTALTPTSWAVQQMNEDNSCFNTDAF